MHLDDFNLDVEPSGSRPLRGLSVVDDSKIRKELFSASRHLLKKIQRLEKDHANFLSHDQILYKDWYNVTFRRELKVCEQLEKRLRSLSTFKVHLQHIARTSRVSLEEAYSMLKQEEAQYQLGDDGWRFIIDKLRQQRYESAIKTQSAPDVAPAAQRTEASHLNEVILNLSDMLRDDESALSGLKRYGRSIYHYLSEIDDIMLARHLADTQSGYQLFKESFQIAMKCGDWLLLARIWKAAGTYFQGKLLKPMPVHLKEFLQQMFAESEAATAEDLQAEITIRSSYRKLARLLHPDMQVGNSSKEFQVWTEKKWQRVQSAYVAKDHVALKSLEIICMAELGHLNQLTVDEIYQASLILADELESLKKGLKVFRKHPAWKFSARRKYDALTNKIKRDLKQQCRPMELQIRDLEMFFKSLAKE